MRRFWILFLVVAVALLLPLGLLVGRALKSAELERRLQYRTVAERVFDEMERALSEILGREEARPFEAYATGPSSRLPFVVGHFQVEPDSRVRTLHTGGDEAARARLSATVGGYFRSGGDRDRGNEDRLGQRPGTTMEIGSKQAVVTQSKDAGRDAGAQEQVSAFDALQSLNKAVQKRAARVPASAESERDSMSAAGGFAGAAAELREARRALALPPMIGRMIDARHLVLHRTVLRQTLGYRQGLVVDVAALGDWLRREVLAGSELEDRARLQFVRASTPAPPDQDGRVYTHRFAEPFADLATHLTLAPLPGAGGTTYIRLLAALLVGATLLGFSALYRMVSVAVSFAERRGNFVAAVSHELKTPLTAIRMYAEMLRDGIVASERKRDEYHRHITTEAERLSRLINNVLEFSLIEKGTRRAALVHGPVAPVVDEIAELLRPHLAREGFELRIELEQDLPPVRFEHDALTQVIFNLVDNAVKYAKNSTPRRITLRVEHAANGVRLSVRDHGPGVPARHLAKIFEPFYRGESELTRRSKGAGIGLALVQGLAACMGATVTGANAPGGGFEVGIRFAPATP